MFVEGDAVAGDAMSTVSHEAFIQMMAECNRHVPINPNDPAIAALLPSLEAAQQEATGHASTAAGMMGVVQDVIKRAIQFANGADELDESDPRTVEILAELAAVREQSHAAAQLALDKIAVVLNILKQIESAARNSCQRFN